MTVIQWLHEFPWSISLESPGNGLHLYIVVTVLLIVLFILLSLILFLLLSPLWIELDTSLPMSRIHWWGIGSAELSYEKEWKAKLRILFFKRIYYLERTKESRIARTKTKKRKQAKNKKPGIPFRVMISKIRRVLRSFIVEKWQVAIDTGDATLNARLFPLNWMPGLQGHLLVNFNGEDYFRCRIRNTGWRLLWAWFRR